jgi:predicted phage terminase large subunit-like protein
MLNTKTLEGFTGSCLTHTFDDPQPIPPFHRKLWQMCTSKFKYVAIAAPRGHAKSTAVTLSYVLASVLFRDHQYVIIISDTESQSTEFLNDIKMQLIENEDIKQLFGVSKFIKDSETNMIVQMDDGHQFRIVAKGAGQRIRGRKWRNKRPDLIVVDDLEDDEAVESKERRAKLYGWFTNAVLPALSDKGKIRVVGTILHMDSVLEKLLNKKSWHTKRYAAHNSDFSEILWPEKFSKERLIAIRESYVEDGNPAGFSQEYLNHPIDESTAYFQRDDFQFYESEDIKDKDLSYYSAIDFAISQAERADYTVICTVGIDSDNKMYVVDVKRGRWDGKEIIERMIDTHMKYRPELFTVEGGAIEKALGGFLNAEMYDRGVFLNLNKMTPIKDKQSRARSIQARMRQGGIYFDQSKSWYPDLEQEMVRFPRDVHDDQVDALAWIGLTLDQTFPGRTKEELDDEEWEEEYGETFFGMGRNGTTGY